jgi:TctA family transporter
MSYDEAVSKFIHEFGHGATFGLNGNETTGLAGKLSKQFPLITRAV